jgi:hypothetical protein
VRLTDRLPFEGDPALPQMLAIAHAWMGYH